MWNVKIILKIKNLWTILGEYYQHIKETKVMTELIQARTSLQETMNFLGAVASGIEQAIGESANSISYLAGKRLGMKLSEDVEKTADIEQALSSVTRVLKENSCLWHFETFQPHDRKDLIQATDDGDEVMLVFRDCMIRQSLFRFGHSQKGSLCNMMFGFFSGALQNIMGHDSTLEIEHAGENACLKRLIIHRNISSKTGQKRRKEQ
jgi:predicted hydrocarbon binding protein